MNNREKKAREISNRESNNEELLNAYKKLSKEVDRECGGDTVLNIGRKILISFSKMQKKN